MNLPVAVVDRLLAYQVECADGPGRPHFALFGICAALARSGVARPMGLRRIAAATGVSQQGVLNLLKIGVELDILENVGTPERPKFTIKALLNSVEQKEENAQPSRAPEPECSTQLTNSVEHSQETLNSVERYPTHVQVDTHDAREQGTPPTEESEPEVRAEVPEGKKTPKRRRAGKAAKSAEMTERVTEAAERWWDLYDLKIGKAEAFKLFVKIPESDWPALARATKNYVAATPDPHFRKHPKRFLEGGFWRDYVGGDPRSNGNGGGSRAPTVASAIHEREREKSELAEVAITEEIERLEAQGGREASENRSTEDGPGVSTDLARTARGFPRLQAV